MASGNLRGLCTYKEYHTHPTFSPLHKDTFLRLEDTMAQVQAQLLTVIKSWSSTYLHDSRLLIISNLENTSVLVLGRSVALGFKKWKFSYHQLREYLSMKSWFFFFLKEHTVLLERSCYFAFQTKGYRVRRKTWIQEQSKEDKYTVSIRALPRADGVGGILSGHPGFSGIRRIS